MKIRAGIAALIIISFLSLSSCAHRESRVENFHGTSFELAKFNQIVNLEAENNAAPVETLDGKAANNMIDTYRKSFLPKKTENTLSLILK
ncbi:MAG: hypothetical protein MUO63_18485 [Desulfobulbaceae bacterium]|nr:hypothetical protein [Desulfobulbaceae bacterium]